MSKANEDDMTRKNKTLHALFEEGAFKYKQYYIPAHPARTITLHGIGNGKS